MSRRVALLARPGVACDRLRGALADVGADLVLEADPLTLDPATLDAAQAQVVLVALDTQTEEALDRLEATLQNPAIEVIFEEAELAARREGWEAARWVRHLAAKLHRHGDVLPPGGTPTAQPSDGADSQAWAVEPASGAALAVDTDSGSSYDASPTSEPAAVGTMHAFDPLFAEMDFGEAAAIDTATDAPTADPSAAFDPSLNFSYDGDYDFPAQAAEPAAFGGGDDFAMGVPSLDEPRGGEPAAASTDPGFDRMFDGDFSGVATFEAEVDVVDFDGGLETNLVEPVADNNKRVLELVSTDDEQAPRGDAEGAAEHRFKHDLAHLESRIAGMELVDDRVLNGPAQANGAVLVMAGIGGPDAVRQLLGALPEHFPRPVLVQQRLDGGRYDKLVAQMQRATAMLVKLAEPGLPAIAGVIYILPAGIGIRVAEAGIQFTDGGDDVLSALPSADSAVLLLSGSDPAQVDAVMNHSWAGALVIGQAPDGCYDAAAPSALLARGGGSGQPAELAERLSERWRS